MTRAARINVSDMITSRSIATAAQAALAVLLMSAAGCSPAVRTPVVDTAAPDRSARPAVGEAPDVALPPVQQFQLANGMRVLVLQKRDLPLVQANLVVRAGTSRDSSIPGLASLTAAMLDEGAAGRSALEIADAFEMLGARFGIGAATHTSTVWLRAPAARFPEALRVAADVVMSPDFPRQELERLRKERLTSLVRRFDQPNAIASVVFDQTLFGPQHPYGRDGIGSAESLRRIRTEDLRTFHTRFYRPGNITAVVVGDIAADEARTLLEQTFGSWQRADVPPDRVADAAQVRGRSIVLVNKPGAAQSVVQFGRIGVPRSTRDYYALEVMNVILGGSFTSRLNQNLREDKGYTYGAASGFDYQIGAGPWSAGAAVQTQSTGPAIAEFMKELRGMREPLPEDEVERARNFLAMRYPAGFQSVAGIAARLVDVVQYDLPADYFNHYVDNVLAVTKADVERVARQYIDADNVTIFVVGDRAAIEPQLRALNLGPIRFLEIEDVLGALPAVDD